MSKLELVKLFIGIDNNYLWRNFIATSIFNFIYLTWNNYL